MSALLYSLGNPHGLRFRLIEMTKGKRKGEKVYAADRMRKGY